MTKLPEVLSFQRGVLCTDAPFWAITPEGERFIPVVRHGIRGTINVQERKRVDKGTEIANVQITESAKTPPNATGIVVRFSMGFVPLDETLFATSDMAFRQHFLDFVERFRDSGELEEVCHRYARNVLNGRWLWRNRILAQVIRITVASKGQTLVETKAVPELKRFGDYTESERKLALAFAEAIRGLSSQRFEIEGRIEFGFQGAVEVFPSQNYPGGKKPDGFARPLYKLNMIGRRELGNILNSADVAHYRADMIEMGTAALRDQKIGNAIRTIDTWYRDEPDPDPIPVEPNGASLKDNDFYRKGANSAFEIMRRMDALQPGNGTLNPEAMFLLAIFLRGGVFSEKDKDSGKNKAKKKEAAG